MSRLCALIVILVCWACSSSEKKTEREEYPDFSEEKSAPAGQPAITMCGSPKVSREHYHVVEICQMKFVPPHLQIQSGDTVEWINRDITNHDVTEEHSKLWQSPPLEPGRSWKKVMTSSADYYCSIHMVMKGDIVAGEIN
jgi:plastocyanin